MKAFNVTVVCQAYYKSSILVPDNLTYEEALQYAKAHIDDIPLGELDYIPYSDEIDEENCELEGDAR